MNALHGLLAAAMLVVLLLGLLRVYRGPTEADRMLAASLMTSAAVGAMLLFGRALGAPAAQDVALVIVLLAALSAVAFARVDPRSERERSP